jgi:hypothetical protein
LNPDQPVTTARKRDEAATLGAHAPGSVHGGGWRQREIPALLRKPLPKAETES